LDSHGFIDGAEEKLVANPSEKPKSRKLSGIRCMATKKKVGRERRKVVMEKCRYKWTNQSAGTQPPPPIIDYQDLYMYYMYKAVAVILW